MLSRIIQIKDYVGKYGSFAKIVHFRAAYDVNNLVTIRANRDTLYSFGVFDLRSPLTVTLPEAGGRYQSLMIVNQDLIRSRVPTVPGQSL